MRTVGPDGVGLAYSLRGGPAPSLVAVHATGFCKEVWHPVLDRLPRVGALLIDQRGHGRSDRPPLPLDWWDLGRDLLRVVSAVDARPLLGVGHSSGGAAVVIAELLAPGTFDAMVLIEPIVFSGVDVGPPVADLAAGARRRRSRFVSIDDAVERLAGRGAFSGWAEEALRAYAEHGTVDDGQGGRVLACSPEMEAACYEAARDDRAWRRLGEITCPVSLVAGGSSDHLSAGFVAGLAERLPAATTTIVPDAGHFLPMEDPEATAAILAARLA